MCAVSLQTLAPNQGPTDTPRGRGLMMSCPARYEQFSALCGLRDTDICPGYGYSQSPSFPEAGAGSTPTLCDTQNSVRDPRQNKPQHTHILPIIHSSFTQNYMSYTCKLHYPQSPRRLVPKVIIQGRYPTSAALTQSPQPFTQKLLCCYTQLFILKL